MSKEKRPLLPRLPNPALLGGTISFTVGEVRMVVVFDREETSPAESYRGWIRTTSCQKKTARFKNLASAVGMTFSND